MTDTLLDMFAKRDALKKRLDELSDPKSDESARRLVEDLLPELKSAALEYAYYNAALRVNHFQDVCGFQSGESRNALICEIRDAIIGMSSDELL